ncbi:MAG: HXXEE domain-containing protein [Deltaproteobacteria bacterium]|nr:HXXEE domain-containing protein [Deltaproteobacteria bacterium]
MKYNRLVDGNPNIIFLMPIFYALHMVEEFSLGFVEWGDRYFGNFDWTQNIIGNTMFFIFLCLACYAYYRDPTKHLWLGMAGAMWILANSFLHISAVVLGGEYSPGVVTATVFYLPGGLYFLLGWKRNGLLNWRNIIPSFILGAMIFMIIPTFARAIHYHAQLAKIFHFIK